MIFDKLFGKKKTIDNSRLVLNVYNSMNSEQVRNIFYGDATEAAKILIPLRNLFFNNSTPSEQQYSEVGFFYVRVWTQKHGGFRPEFSTTSYIKNSTIKRFPNYSSNIVIQGVDLSLEFIYLHEPSLADRDFNMTRNEATLGVFSDEYIMNYRKGVMLFEQKQYNDAIDAFGKCLEIKKNDSNSLFEIAEAYIQMADYLKAKETLDYIATFVSLPNEKARLFRRLAFIEIENVNYNLATALLLYSLTFENNRSALNELMYIESITGNKIQLSNQTIMNILVANKIPL